MRQKRLNQRNFRQSTYTRHRQKVSRRRFTIHYRGYLVTLWENGWPGKYLGRAVWEDEQDKVPPIEFGPVNTGSFAKASQMLKRLIDERFERLREQLVREVLHE